MRRQAATTRTPGSAATATAAPFGRQRHQARDELAVAQMGR
ncbi:hypothetical protein [Streptomyces sp. NPDC051576]